MSREWKADRSAVADMDLEWLVGKFLGTAGEAAGDLHEKYA